MLSVTKEQLGMSGGVRDLGQQKDLSSLGAGFSALVSPHGAAFLKVKP